MDGENVSAIDSAEKKGNEIGFRWIFKSFTEPQKSIFIQSQSENGYKYSV